MYYLYENNYKPITVQYYKANCVSWMSRLTFLDLRINWLTNTLSEWNSFLNVGELLCIRPTYIIPQFTYASDFISIFSLCVFHFMIVSIFMSSS